MLRLVERLERCLTVRSATIRSSIDSNAFWAPVKKSRTLRRPPLRRRRSRQDVAQDKDCASEVSDDEGGRAADLTDTGRT